MGQKKEAKEAKALFKAQESAELEWAKKRGKEYPLSLADQQLYQQKKLEQQRFWEMKDRLINGNKKNIKSKPVSTVNNTPKPWPLWTYDDVISDEKLYRLMTKAEMDKAVSKIEGEVHCSISCYTPGYTEFSLSYKSQCCEESGLAFYFDRASIMVSPSQNIAKHLYIGADDEVNATFYAGYDIDDENEDSWDPPMIGILVFADKNNQNHAVELQEFSALIETKEDEAYIFTFYSKAENMLLIKHLTNLEYDNPFSDRDIVMNTGNNETQTPLLCNA